ncbi:hypothetical protein BHU72_14275 [Desulfuribacillus stibiiarsenatis]|uniref:LemA family protein n=1 Tax=Desulfuribacillus stibiiarsenatis TaxID=1390249 RepID=A0A1E5L7G3_9FIRM|nr:LemA family protein [Desulfuribacillus stibiiarsenatis]OEH86090.1 hypothetical protein BHU72_14275 [Desulfuribacillus stibiiarsenatis]
MTTLTIAFLAITGIIIIFIYNQFVTLRQRVKNSWAQIEVELHRRYELIPNLIDTVKAYANHEQETLENVTKARVGALSSQNVQEQAGAESILTATLKNLFAVAEKYPELKADVNFQKLQQELVNTEGNIAFARQFYNDTVQKYNTRIEMFPYNLFAGIFNFYSSEYFSLTEREAREAVAVEFRSNSKE